MNIFTSPPRFTASVLISILMIFAASFLVGSQSAEFLGISHRSQLAALTANRDLPHRGDIALGGWKTRQIIQTYLGPESSQMLLTYPSGLVDENIRGFYDAEVNGKSLDNGKKFPKFDGYIIQYKEPAVLEKKAELEKAGVGGRNLSTALSDQRSKIEAKHSQLKSNLSDIDSSLKIDREFNDVFSGASVRGIDELKAREIKSLSYVKKVSPNYIVHTTLMDSISLINADDVWELDANWNDCAVSGESCLTGEGVTIGIIDTGVDYTHGDLGGCLGVNCKVIGGWDFVNGDGDPMDDHGHGTHVAATAAGNGTLKGVAPDANIVAYKVLNAFGSGTFDDVIFSIENSVDPNQDGDFFDRLDIISLSLGGPGDPDDPVSQAIDNVVENGVVAIVAAGNSGLAGIASPGTARNAITVGAMDKQSQIAGFSSKGPVIWGNKSLVKPDIVAPGVDICAAQWDSAWPDQECLDTEHTAISGTSMATPHVSGFAALVKQMNPGLNPREIKSVIKSSAVLVPGQGGITGQGLGSVDAMRSRFFVTNPVVASLDPIEQNKPTIDITGRITGELFDSYTLAWAPDFPLDMLNDSDWNAFANSSSIPSDDVLYSGFDIRGIPDGNYLIKLEVTDSSPNPRKFYDYGYLVIDKFGVVEPLNNDIANPKDDLAIKVDNKLNLVIDSFDPVYSFKGGPWQGAGLITDVNELGATLSGGTITDSGDLSFRISIEHNGIVEEKFIQAIAMDNTLKSGWPIRVPYEFAWDPFWEEEIYYWAGFLEPALGDLNGDGKDELIIYSGGLPPKIRIYNLDGVLLDIFEIGIEPAPGGNLHHPLLADLDNDGLSEIIAVNPLNPLVESSRVDAFNYGGSLLWSVDVPKDYHPTLLAADLDRNGDVEIVIKGNDGLVVNVLTILGNDGQILNEWDLWENRWAASLEGTPAVGNLDGDPELEIIIANLSENAGYHFDTGEWINEGYVYAYNSDGSVVNGWPVVLPGEPFSSPVVGDIDDDGNNEVVIGLMYVSDTYPDERYGGLWALDKDGQILWSKFSGFNFWSTPALADLDSDGDLEIGISKLENPFETYILDHNGNILSGWPQTKSWNDYYSSIFGSVNNGDFGLVTTAGHEVYAWDVLGNLLDGFPKLTETDAQAPAQVGDLDNDGDVELVASSNSDFDWFTGREKLRGSIYVWETPNSLIEEKQVWPMFHHDKQLTGCHNCESVNQFICGNGIVEPGEECDGGATCNEYCGEIEGGGGSFLAGTQISMADGTTKNIEAVEVGDWVMSYDSVEGKIVNSEVTALLSHRMPGYYLINDSLKITATNPIWADGRWKYPSELKMGDELLTSDKRRNRVYSIKYIAGSVAVYNLQVEGTQSYFAGGVGVHNAKIEDNLVGVKPEPEENINSNDSLTPSPPSSNSPTNSPSVDSTVTPLEPLDRSLDLSPSLLPAP